MIIELKDICKTYVNGQMDVPVLFDVNLNVDEGEFVSIMGPSGSGKSTLLNIIGCLDRSTSGSYMFMGEDISNKSDDELSEIRNTGIGFIFQQFNLLPKETALANVALPLVYADIPYAERMRRAEEALAKVGLSERKDFLPTQLSGGQKQRVAIARALVNNPKVVLADEPTGALDSKSGEALMELLVELNKSGTTIIMITHEHKVAEYGNRILEINDGILSNYVRRDEHSIK